MTVIELPFPPSLNNMFINGSKGRFRSQKYDEWIMEAGWEINRQKPPKVAGPVVLFFHFQDGRDKRKRDVSNFIKPTEDLLVKHGIIEADDNSIVRGIEAYWDDTVTGVKIVIVPPRPRNLTGYAGDCVNNWKSLGEITSKITDRLAPVTFSVPLQGSLAVALMVEATRSGNRPETIMAESVRAYLGDA